jgi:hypothetical protein
LDVFEASARVLSLAACGASHAKIMTMHKHLRQDEMRWLLKMLVDRNLLEIDSSAAYWATVDGVKFLEIQFHMERILQAQKSLV